MGKDLKYFMRDHADEIVTVPGPETIKDENGEPIMLEVKVLSNTEIQKINDSYRKRSIATDKKGNPMVSGGEVIFRTEKDSSRAVRHIMAEALVYPNLKDKGLMEFYKCVDVTEMPRLVFSRSDEFSHVQRVVLTALGLIEGTSDDETIEAAKN